MAREYLSKKIRFEVFKRDSFTCQYCGRSAPDVTLVIDHIHPVSDGGNNDIVNLITACQDCNSGKSNRKLSDNAVVKKRKAQLDELQKRREQLAMMLRWQQSLINLDEDQISSVDIMLKDLSGYSLTDHGRSNVRQLIKKFGISEILECTRISAGQYLERDNQGKPTMQSAEKTLDYIGRIATNRKRLNDKPYLKDLYYIRGILHNRFTYFNDWMALELLETAYKSGLGIEELKDIAKTAKNWTEWRSFMEGYNNAQVPQATR